MDEPPSAAAASPAVSQQRPTAQQLKQVSGKRAAAAFINTDMTNAGTAITPLLEDFLHLILNPERRIDDSDNIEWCKFLIAGGRTPAEFAAIGK